VPREIPEADPEVVQMFSYADRIVSRAEVCGGAPTISGTRIRVKVILDNLADGLTPEQTVNAYTGLTIDDVRAVIAFAAASVTDDTYLPCPNAIGCRDLGIRGQDKDDSPSPSR
jgi:uncharacterized protein (DUF433 family)